MESFIVGSRDNETRDRGEYISYPCRQLFKKVELQPHRSIYWLNAKPDELKEERIDDICEVYHETSQKEDELVISVDEMTGVQALERISDELPMSQGKPVAREFEYERYGTQTVIAGFNVTTGGVNAVCGDTRKEDDFVFFIEDTIRVQPKNNQNKQL